MDSEYSFIDLHCHPAMKPYGRSFKRQFQRQNSSNRRHRRSIWHYDPPSLGDKLLNYLTGLTKFSQSDFTSLGYGRVRVVCASLYPLEKWFINNKLGTGLISDIAGKFAVGIGKARIDFVQEMDNYFSDLEYEYAYYRQLHDRTVKLEDGDYTYRLARNFQDLEMNLHETDREVISVILSIEGAHVFNTGLRHPANAGEVSDNVRRVKRWEFKPFFITLAHHFYNELCGHAPSLTGIVARNTDQSEGMGEGFTPLGLDVVEQLLDDTQNDRILTDIKHMSRRARDEYYQLLENNYSQEDIPLLVSHGAVNGLHSPSRPLESNPWTAGKLQKGDINFYDDEILKIAESGGLIGLQLDERRIASPAELERTKKSISRDKILHHRSKLLWNQVQHIAETLDREGRFAWGCMAIGSDFDGIIDPLNGYWTAKEMPHLHSYLERHAYNYMEGDNNLQHHFNLIEPNEMVNRILYGNALNFFQRYF